MNGQENRLAAEYFRSGEYEKAATLYNKLYLNSNLNLEYFTYYFKSLIFSEQYDEARKAIENHLNKRPGDVNLYVWEGFLSEKLGKTADAEKYFKSAISNLNSYSYQIINVANAFIDLSKYDYAIEAYRKGLETSPSPEEYYKMIGDTYLYAKEKDKMLENYLLYLRSKNDASSLSLVESNISRIFSQDDYILLESKLISDIQEHPDDLLLIDMLSWTYIQLGNYDKAFKQLSAIDIRYNEDGNRVFKLAQDAQKSEQYAIAAKAYKYIIDNKDQNSPYYLISAKNFLQVSSERLISDTTTTKEDLLEIEKQYKKFIDIYGINSRSTFLILGLAELQALYLHEPDTAIAVLEDFIGRNNIDDESKAKAKLALGDYYMIKGEIWDASLLYSQVDKQYKEGELGEIARYKNGKLYYYTGDFDWAQIIFDILKPATSKLISNDAIETSVFITEGMGEDTLHIPLNMYANADLLVLENKFDEALTKLDSISFLFPTNDMEDEILYLKAQIYKKVKNFNSASKMYENVIEKYPKELKADNSIYELADIMEHVYKDKDKAKSLYEKLFMDYPDSTFAIEARKKYRQLNGENVP